MEKLASVIIPVYNVEPYVKECMDSVLNQSYKQLEILIVDDGSTDHSGVICDSYCFDPRVTVFHQPNSGVSAARNTALNHAKGEYIFFVDPDDYVHPDLVSKAVASLEENEADMVFFGLIELHGNGLAKIVPTKSLGLTVTEIKKQIAADDIENYSWNKAYRRQLWKNQRFPLGIKYEDVAIIPHITKAATKIVTLKEPLYYYRVHSSSYTHERKFDPSREYSLIRVLRSLDSLALSYKDPQVIVNLRGKILYRSIKLAMMNYSLNELSPEEAHSLEECITNHWDKTILKYLGFQAALQRWLIIHSPFLAHCYGKFRYH